MKPQHTPNPTSSSLPNPNLNKSINPESGGPQFGSGHQLKYKFKNDDSKDRLQDIVKAGWKLWTDNGLDQANIDFVETPDGGDNDILTIEVSSDPKSGDQGGIFRWRAEKEGFCTDLNAASREGWSSVDFIPYGQSNLCSSSDAYDEDSIMHYPGGAGAKKPLIGHRKTVLGTKADPNTSFKKNINPSSTDIDRANAMYTGQGNQKRDGDCAPAQGGQQPEPEDPEDAEEVQEDAEEEADDGDDD
ncbi:MAG: hypothetical protein Q9199_003592 [Rusavskia elegans]